MKKYFLLLIFTAYQIVIAQNVNQINLAKVDVVGNTSTSENTIIFTSGLREGTLVNPTDEDMISTMSDFVILNFFF